MCTPSRTYSGDQDGMNYIPYICSRNLLVLSIMYIVTVMAALYDWRGIASLAISLLYVYGVICNFQILRRTDQKYCIENLSCVQSLIQILRGGKWVLIRLGTLILQFVERSSSFLKGLSESRCSSRPTERATRIDGVQTPGVPQGTSFKSLTKEKSNSEPIRETYSRSSHLQVKTSGIAKTRITMKTPELFKNKIYRTRRTLINAQDELFNDNVTMF